MKIYLALIVALLISGCSAVSRSPVPATNNRNTTAVNEAKPADSKPETAPQGNSLDLSNKGLNALPAYVLSMQNLTELNISQNKLSGALPAEIRQLKNLKKLVAGHNAMTGIPAEIGQLSQLEEIDVSYNEITGMPYELGNLKNLRILNLTGNAFSKKDLAVIHQNLPDLKVIF